MKKLSILFIISLAHLLSFSQTCVNDNVYDNPDRYKFQENFIPSSSDPVKTIRLHLHFLQNSTTINDKGNYENNTAHNAFVDLIIERVNYIYSNLETPASPPTCCTSCYIEDNRIRFEIADKSYHFDPTNYFSGSIMDILTTYNSHDPEVLDYFFMGDGPNGNGDFPIGGTATPPSSTNLSKRQIGIAHNYFKPYEVSPTTHIQNATDIARNMAHELAHTMGLKHCYNEGYAPHVEPHLTGDIDYLDDFWGSGGPSCIKIPVPTSNACGDGGNPGNTCSRNVMGGSLYVGKRELTPEQIGRMHRSSMLASVSRYFKASSNLVADHEVSSDETWDFNIRMYGNIVVEDGATLTIRCTVHMPPTAKIIVEPGCKLIIDGGTVTSVNDDHMWGGIEIRGTSDKSQYPYSNGIQYQGTLVTMNGAVIENAVDAITNWKPYDWAKIGGIIQASNTTFKNNRRSAAFIAYQNHVPNQTAQLLDNLSYFKACTFIHDEALNDGQNPIPMVTMWEVDGIAFLGCTFKYDDYNPTFQRTALYSLDASYIVKSYCTTTSLNCPPANWVQSEFNNLDIGVLATGSGSYAPVRVLDASFIDVYNGIAIDHVNNCEIIDNTFTTSEDLCGIGILLDGASDYTVEGNSLNNGAETLHMGVFVENSGGDYNEIYRNSFSGLPHGIVATGANAYKTNEPYHWAGLKFLCNSFDENTGEDIWITSQPGAAYFQGTMTPTNTIMEAGNSFSDAVDVGFHYYNGAPYTAKYFYNGSSTNHEPTLSYNTIKYGAAARSCEQKRSARNWSDLSPQDLTDMQSKFGSTNDAYKSAKTTLKQTLDGGDTESLLSDIEGSGPGDETSLTTQLINSSPLTNEAVLSAINLGILSNSQLYSIIEETPSAMCDNAVISALETKTDPMSSSTISDLVALSLVPDDRDKLLMKIAYHKERLSEYHSIIVDHFDDPEDTIPNNDTLLNDSLLYWLGIFKNEHSGKVRQIGAEMALGDLSKAEALISQWQNVSYNNAEDIAHRSQLSGFWGDYIDNFFDASGTPIWPSDADYLSDLSTLEAAKNEYTSAMAANILRYHNQGTYQFPTIPSLKKETQSLYEKYVAEVLSAQLTNISLYPNPATDGFSLEIPDAYAEEVNIKIMDFSAQTVFETNQSGSTISINPHLEPGSYIVQITSQGNVPLQTILIIQ